MYLTYLSLLLMRGGLLTDKSAVTVIFLNYDLLEAVVFVVY